LEAGQAGLEAVAPLVELLIELRQDLRKAGQYALADRIRERLTELKIVLEDGKQGTTWRMG
jgi:cysteinyl-tRNA synthetase